MIHRSIVDKYTEYTSGDLKYIAEGLFGEIGVCLRIVNSCGVLGVKKGVKQVYEIGVLESDDGGVVGLMEVEGLWE